MRMTKTKKTLYWDVKTAAKLRKVKNKFRKHNVSDSQIVRSLIQHTPFEVSVAYLNADLKLVDKIPLERM